MTATALRRKAALATAISAGTAFLLVSAHPAWADNVTLNNGDTQNYTPAPVQAGNGVSHRTIGAQPTTINNSTEVNFNATSAAPTTSSQFIFTATALDTISGLAANTSLESVAKLNITTAGAYTIFYNTDDGGRLYIDGRLIINNEGPHGDTRLSKVVVLDAGLHDVRSLVVNNGGGGGMQLSYSGPDSGNTRVLVPNTALFLPENTAANALSPAVSTTVRANNITPVTVGVAPDNITLPAAGTATINLNGTSFAAAGLGTLTAPAGSGLNVTGVIGASADTRRQLTFVNGTTLGGAGTYSFNNALDLNLGRVTGSAAGTIINKLGGGQLILDNSSGATPNDLTGATINIQGGSVYAQGNALAGSSNPLGTSTVNLNGGMLSLDIQGGGAAAPVVSFANVITVGINGGTLQSLAGPGTYNLTSTTPINLDGPLTLNTFGGSQNVVGSTMVISAP